MRESEIEDKLNELQERLDERTGEENEEDEDLRKDLQTLKMQVGKLRSRIQDLEEALEDDE